MFQIIELSLLDFLSTSYVDGPSRIAITFEGLQMFVCPTRVNFFLIFLNHLLSQIPKAGKTPEA